MSTSGGLAGIYGQWQQTAHNLALASGVWTAYPMNVAPVDKFGIHPTLTATTTVAAGSDGLVLPQASISVASTVGLPATIGGHQQVAITGPPGANIDTVIDYTGTSGGNTLTGCTGGTGTLHTGQTVTAANAWFTPQQPVQAGIYLATCTASFLANPTGNRGIRFATSFLGTIIAIQQLQVPTGNIQQDLNLVSMPILNAANPLMMQVWQDSGTVVQCAQNGLAAPILSLGFLCNT